MKFRRKVVVVWILLTMLVRCVDSAATGFKPYFENVNVVLQVLEDTAKDTVVSTINAKDTENDPITFGLDNTGKELFNIEVVDSNTVNLKLKAKLNRELTTSYEFQVTITDDPNDASRLTRKDFYLTVLDVNDNAPVFTEQPYRTSVAENTTINTVLITIKAVDADAAANGVVVYRFSNSSSDITLLTLWTTDKFSINNLNGEIKLISSLDFEKTSRYVLSVVAEDGGIPKQTSETTVVIDVTDISDMPPKFEQSIYIKEVYENIPLNSPVITVVARDGDTGVNNPIQYQIYQGNDAGSFAINSNTGVITVNGSIDAEQIQSYTLYIRASEIPDPSSNTTVKVLITVIDKNDNPPVLSQNTYSFDVREDLAKVGRIVTNQLIVSDADKNPDYRRHKFYLSGGDSSMFSIDPNSGLLTINSTLDYETQINYTFTIEVIETGTAEKYSDNATVYVNLINANDNTPKFLQSTYNFTFDEEISPGSSIAVINATDADLGTFGKITYELKGDDATFFHVGADSGNITAAKTLDYETKALYTLVLHAKDGGGIDYKETIATVNVYLHDINDNDPIFTASSFSKTISENLAAGTAVIHITATDKDSGENGRVTFSIIAGNTGTAFAINGTGFVTTTTPLDREVTAKYTLTILASDHGSPSRNKTTDLEVIVGDENDNAPVIAFGSYVVYNISEDAGGGTVIFSSIEAPDIDEGVNSVLLYSMSGGDGRFTLNSETGKLQLSPTGLDREVKSSYDLVINVTDRGSPPRYNTTTVHVNILDINDNAPEFVPSPSQSPQTYIVTVNEGPATINSTILNINATDKDDGANGEIRFALDAGDEHHFFGLDATTGVLTAVKELDREDSLMSKDTSGKGRFFLDITATDQANTTAKRKSAVVRVTVFVSDLNDNSPKFAKSSFSTHISEATLTGSNVIQVSADDQDWDNKGKVTYNITAGDPNGNFEITPNGYIAVKKPLDAEVASLYNLTVTASDEGTPPLTSQTHVAIYIDDINDNDPVFNQSTYRASLKENVAKGTSVVTVYATDIDKGVNGRIIYKISSGNTNNAFEINNDTGVIVTAGGEIDREAIQLYRMTIQAEDQGVPSTRKDFAEVVITVDDVNDNAPTFPQTSYVGEIPENSPPGTLLEMKTSIKATDKDIGDNAKLSFSLSGPGANNFHINASTAVITASSSSSLDREKNNTYSLTITVADGGGLNKSVPLTVTITDVNDESPRFSNHIYYANVSEGASRGTVVRRVTADDNDLGINKEIIYTSIGADAKFYIDRTKGDIIVDSNLDREFKDQYTLNVTAANIIGNVPDGHALVIITITDVIDSAPYFSSETITVSLAENAVTGSNVTMVTALDKDVGDTLTYDIVGGDVYGQFSIDNVTGEIKTADTLNRENMTKYTLVVKAKDSTGRSDTVNVVVKITDYNDQAPVFTQHGFTVVYREQSPKGTSVVKVSATDADEGVNAEITYSIVENITEYVTIDASTGIVTQGPVELDRELTSFLNFTVKATDKGSPALSSTVNVSVELIDINDNNPTFENNTYYGYVKENQPTGTQVIVITGSDADIGTNAQLEYGLSGSLDFEIDSNTGNVTTREVLNREVTDKYTLKVRAVDGAIRAREGSTTLVVSVLDDNDHAPAFTKDNYLFNVIENVNIGHSVDKVVATDKDIDNNAKISYSIVAGNYKLPNWFTTYDFSWPLNSVSQNTIKGSTLGTTKGSVTPTPGPAMPALALNGINGYINFGDFTKTCLSSPELCLEGMSIVFWLKLDALANSYTTFSREGVVLSSGGELPRSKGVVVYLNDRELHVLLSTANSTWNCSASFTIDKWMLVAITWTSDVGLKLYFNSSIEATSISPMKTADKRTVDSSTRFLVGRSNGGQAKHAGFSISSLAVQYRVIGWQEIQRILISDKAFAINVTTGEITTASTLDRETNSSFVLTVMAKDAGIPSKQSNATVTIVVQDYNDNPPVFLQHTYNATMKESTRENTKVTTVEATDADVGINSQFTYKIQSGDDNNVFSLDETTGVMILKGKLDHEAKPLFNMTISAKDRGNPSLTGYALVLVTVTDVDDNAPVFTQDEYTFNVYENITKESIVGQVNATDFDTSKEHSIIHYAIESGNDGDTFSIGEFNGSVALRCGAGCLNREKKNRYELTISGTSFVNNTAQKSTAKLTITVLDVNDEVPVFVSSNYKEITEDIQPFSPTADNVIFTVSAKDSDLGSNAEIMYYIVSGNEQGYFTLNNKTGELSKAKQLDREKTSSFTLVIKAIDQGDPPLASNTTVRFTVKDVNDNHPKFTNAQSEEYRVLENITVGTFISLINATDDDEGVNSMIEFVIISGDSDGAFQLNKTTGELTTAKALDHETTSVYQLIIQAKDIGIPQLTNQKTIKVIVTDLNDNKPTFNEKTVTLTVRENAPAGTRVGKIFANDLDTTDKIYFYIVETSGREYFYINETTGELWTKKQLDREKHSSYKFSVLASNVKLDPATFIPGSSTGNSSNSNQGRRRRAVGGQSTQEVVINIGDKNDNFPIFKSKEYSGGVTDNIKHGAKALQVTAVDADSGNNSRIAYFIVGTERFTIEKSTGWILAASSFAGEHGKEYIFTVTAKDNFGEKPYYSDNTTVKIYILVDKEKAVLISGRSPEDVRANKDLFKQMLENITGYIINIDDINYKQNEDGEYDYTKTALLFHAIDPTTRKIISRDDLIKKIDENYLNQKAFFQEWKITEVKEYVAPKKKSGFSLWVALAIGLAVLVILIILIFCCVILLLRKRQKRKLRAATAASYGGSTHVSRQSSMSTLPNTNLHNAEGSNPIWVDPYQNWGVTDDDESDFQTFKSTNGSLPTSNGGNLYGDLKIKPSTNNPLFESTETFMNIDFDNNESPDVDLSTVDHMSLSRKSSDNHTPSPEPYESSPTMSERNYQYNDSDKYQVTSI